MRSTGMAGSISKCFSPPVRVRGMTVLNRDEFFTNFLVKRALYKGGQEKKHLFLKTLKPLLLKMPKFKPIQCQDPKTTAVYLNPKSVASLDLDSILSKAGLKQCDYTVDEESIQVGYENFNAEDVFRAVLPKDCAFNSHSFIGHIAHVNLKDPLLPYKRLIGQVLLDKNPRCKTVINKTEVVEGKYRNLQFEHIAGEEMYIARVLEHGFVFELDFSKVFWNSRLSTEHAKLVSLCHPDDLIIDVFAGVGPFAIPLAAKKCTVLANDLNADCIQWLKRNCQINKVNLETHCLDAAEFLQNVCPRRVAAHCAKLAGRIRVIMNLPASAVQFLPHLKGLCAAVKQKDNRETLTVTVHCYLFSKTNECPELLAEQIVREHLENVQLDNVVASYVRNVSPSKHMIRVDFDLPKEFVF